MFYVLGRPSPRYLVNFQIWAAGLNLWLLSVFQKMFKYLLQNIGHINTEKHYSNCGKTLTTPQQLQENQLNYI